MSPNSDSEQCTESRLDWVHRVHTLNLGCTHAARWAGHIVAHQAYRGRVIAHTRPYRNAVPRAPCYCLGSRVAAPLAVSQRPYTMLQGVGRYIIALSVLYRDPKSPLPPLSYDTIFVSRPTPGKVMRARADARFMRWSAVS